MLHVRRIPALFHRAQKLHHWQRLAKRSTRSFSDEADVIATQRHDILKKVYAPLLNLTPGSDEYLDLMENGSIWEEYFKPYDIQPYLEAQSALKEQLVEVDRWKPLYKHQTTRTALTKALIAEYSHQSVSIEGNPLSLGDTLSIENELDRALKMPLLQSPDIFNEPSLLAVPLPPPESILPGKDKSQVAELRNHIFVCKLLVNAALRNPNTAGVSLDATKLISASILADTTSESVYESNWGCRISLGDFRNTPVQVRANPLRIFPYPLEIPALLQRFFEWRTNQHEQKTLHPLILATHICIYFVHIHPFLDGNGRTSRLLMADYLIRQGYFPVIFQNLGRPKYLKMVSDAQDHRPKEICRNVVETQLDMLISMVSSKL